jgi:hypothetical protein
MPQPARSPVEFFRELLAMNLAERNRALAYRPPETHRQILAKVREYEALKPDQRELRLQATELRWYLLPLMRAAPTNRTVQLSIIPAGLRPLVEVRLQDWDKLPAEIQKEFLAKEAAILLFTQFTNKPPTVKDPTPRPPALDERVRELQRMPPEERQQLLARWSSIFDLSEAEKDKVLRTLSASERAQMEKSLKKFGNLTPQQRANCIRYFELFASMSLEERQQLLNDAVKWSRLTPDQRKQWQELVEGAALLPPAALPVLRPAPLPQRVEPRAKKVLATNGG